MLHYTEFEDIGEGPHGAIQAPGNPLASGLLTPTDDANTQSAAFNARTRLVEIHAEEACRVAFGDNPDAMAAPRILFAAGDTKHYRVHGGQKLAVVLYPSVPGAPTIGLATAGDEQASVAFTAPADNGGAAITEYTVTSTPGDIEETGASSPIVVTGLTNATEYTFTVRATNSAGDSAESGPSNAVTPEAP